MNQINQTQNSDGQISLFAILLGVLVLGAVLRLVFLESIPAYQVDEGSWNIAVRDKVLEGDWCYHIRKFCVSPVHSVLFYLWFLLWSPGLCAARVLSILVDLGSIILMYVIGSKLFSRRLGLIASFLFAINSIVILNGRKAMLETDSVFWILLALYLFTDRALWRRIPAGIVMALAIGTKLYAFKMLIIFGVYEVMLFWGERGWKPFRALLGWPFLIFLAVTMIGTALIFGTVYHYYPAEFMTERTSYASPLFLLPNWFGPDSLLFSIKYHVLRDGLTLLLAVLAFVFLVRRWRHKTEEPWTSINLNAVFLIHWFWIIFLSVALMNYQPPRYYFMVVPSYIFLAALFVDRELFPFPYSKSQGKSYRVGVSVLAILLLVTLVGKIGFYFVKGQRNTSAPEALAWVNEHIPHSASIAADYYMTVSLPHDEIWPLHPQRYYRLSQGTTWMVDDYFLDPFGLPDYYRQPVPGHFRHRSGEFPDYVLMPVNHGGTGGQVRFKRFMRSLKFTENYSVFREFTDPNGFRTILYAHNSLSESSP